MARPVFRVTSATIFLVGSACSLIKPAAAQAPKAGTIETLAGTGMPGNGPDKMPATQTQIADPNGIAVDAAGNIFIPDQKNFYIRKVTTDGIMHIFVGDGTGGYVGDNGPALQAEIGKAFGLGVDAKGNLYIADDSNNVIREVTPGGTITTLAGVGSAGYSGDGDLAVNAELSSPKGVAFDGAGNLYIADRGNGVVREVTPDGKIHTFAGDNSQGKGYSGDGGPAVMAQFNGIYGLAADPAGDVFIADSDNNVVRKVDTKGIITTYAGNNMSGYSGDGGPATQAELNCPSGSLAVDGASNLFIPDSSNNVVREVDTNGIIHTVAGNTMAGWAGDGGPATQAELDCPTGVAIDPKGNLYVADSNTGAIREIFGIGAPTPASSTLLPGDVTGDGKVTAGDATLVLRAAVGLVTLTPDQAKAAEVTGDSSPSVGDVILILRRAIGAITSFPSPKA